VFLSEAGVLLLGFAASGVIGFIVESAFRKDVVDALAVYFGFLLSVLGLFLYRGRTRSWKIAYDVEGYRLREAERRLHPAGTRAKRVIGRSLVWIPSLMAAFVFFFFPVASHLTCPTAHYLRHYKIPIPLTATVLRLDWLAQGIDGVIALMDGRGIKDFGSSMTFGGGHDETVDYQDQAKRERATQVGRRDLQAGKLKLSCWQWFAWSDWRIYCQTASVPGDRSLDASFFGKESNIPIFYRVVEGITLVD
jgi:hypothetical protein